jgi:hypothetical protein
MIFVTVCVCENVIAMAVQVKQHNLLHMIHVSMTLCIESACNIMHCNASHLPTPFTVHGAQTHIFHLPSLVFVESDTKCAVHMYIFSYPMR